MLPKVVDITAITGQRIASPVTSWQTINGPYNVEHLAGMAPNGDLLVFWWSPKHDWQWVNVSQKTGHKVASSVTSWQTTNGPYNVEHLAGMAPNGDLLVFWWSPKHDWQSVNVSQKTGHKVASPVTSWQTTNGPYNVEHLAGMAPNGDLLVFWWSPKHDWQSVNVSQKTGHKVAGPVTSWQTRSGQYNVEHLAGTSPTGQLLVFWWSPKHDWQVVNASTIAGGLASGVPTAYQVRDDQGGAELLSTKSPEGSLLLYVWTPSCDWQVINLSRITGYRITSAPEAWLVPSGDHIVEHLAAEGDNHSLLLFWFDSELRHSNLPIVEVYAFRRIPDEPKVPAYVTIFTSVSGGRVCLNSPVDFSGRIGIEIRGQSSQSFPKKQYGIELWDRSNNDVDASLLGMPAESDWILQGPYSDKTLMRNWLAYHLSNAIGRYAVRTRFVEVFKSEPQREQLYWWQEILELIFGRQRWWPWRTYDYVGVYVLMEKIKRDLNRVAITRLNPEDATEPAITGGYILKIDKLDPGDESFETVVGKVRVIYEYPRDITAAQKNWIQNYVNAFDQALSGPNFIDPLTGYSHYIDVDSFVDFFLLQEFFRNVDGFRISTFMHKDRSGKLTMGPVWDFDIAMGNVYYCEGWKEDGWLVLSPWASGECGIPVWWQRFLQDPSFVTKAVSRWQQLRQAELTTSNLFAVIDRMASLLQDSQTRNFARWQILGQYVWPNWPPFPPDYAGEIQRLKAWLQTRAAWIDANIPSL